MKMLDVDYTLKTKKGTKVQTDVPLDEIRHIDGNIMLVQGPSSMGKSTVMNMIALGCFGDSNPSLSQSVRTDINDWLQQAIGILSLILHSRIVLPASLFIC